MPIQEGIVTLYTAATYRFFCPDCFAKGIRQEVAIIRANEAIPCPTCGALYQMTAPTVFRVMQEITNATSLSK